MRAPDGQLVRRKLCAADIGESCFGPISDRSFNRKLLLERALERDILKLSAGIIDIDRKILDASQEPSDRQETRSKIRLPKMLRQKRTNLAEYRLQNELSRERLKS